jgi:hypothetical protein
MSREHDDKLDARWYHEAAKRARGRALGTAPHNLAMGADLTNTDKAILIEHLRETIASDRFPLSPRIKSLKEILAKLDPRPPKSRPLPAPKAPDERSMPLTKKRRRCFVRFQLSWRDCCAGSRSRARCKPDPVRIRSWAGAGGPACAASATTRRRAATGFCRATRRGCPRRSRTPPWGPAELVLSRPAPSGVDAVVAEERGWES